MYRYRIALALLVQIPLALACTARPPDAPAATDRPAADPALAAFIDRIRVVDNHTHANSIAPGDADADALPLDGLAPFEVPVRLRPDHPDWLAGLKALYKYRYDDLRDDHRRELIAAEQDVVKTQGDRFPAWVLDQIGTEVLLANRVAMGAGLAPPRFRWVSFADPLIFPLSTALEAAATPDREKLFPLDRKLLERYLADLKIRSLPPTLDAYLKTIVTPTLENQRRDGSVAVKFEAAYLRSLDFDDVPIATASAVYAKHVGGTVPTHEDYKRVQDFLFRYVAREAGRLGLAVHVHSFEGAGNYFRADGADPLLLESVFSDPALRATRFVIIHGGGALADHAGAMLWKPNVFVDTSLMTLVYSPARLSDTLERWLIEFPEKVLFGSDASPIGPDMGWELAAWNGTRNGRAALVLALTRMMRSGEISRARAEEIATMVLRTNAAQLYKLGLP